MGRRRENDSPDSRDEMISELGQAYAAALLSGDEIAAEAAIRDAMDAEPHHRGDRRRDHRPGAVARRRAVGAGEITVADEHLATEISMRVVTLQREAQRVGSPAGDHGVILATPAGELHVVALRMIANLLRDAGYDVLMLGADVPAEALAASARLTSRTSSA